MNPGNELPLRDIHLPDPVSWWPPAAGWWLMLALLLIGLILGGYLRLRYQRGALQRSARQALREIGQRYQQSGDTQVLAQQLSTLLRRLTLSHYPRRQVAGLTGCDWLALLDRTLPGRHFQEGTGRVLLEAPYCAHAPVDGPALLQLCERWVRALPKTKGACV